MSLKSALYMAAAMAAMASQGYGSAFGSSMSPRTTGNSKTTLTPKQKKVRKANKTASKSRAKNRRK